MDERLPLLQEAATRERSHTAPDAHVDNARQAPEKQRRFSDLFANLVTPRGRSGSMPDNTTSNPFRSTGDGARFRRGSHHSLGVVSGHGSIFSTSNGKTGSGGRRNSGFQVNPVDPAVYESLERLNHEEHGDGHRMSLGSEPPGASSHNLSELALPAPPPLKSLNGTPLDDLLAENELSEPTCLICLGRFTQRRPPIQIPCTNKCNLAPVHARCIYEWKEQRGGISTSPTGSCPLCRAPLTSLDYIPPDPLATKTLFMHSARKSFVSRPAPKAAGMVRAYVRVVGAGLITGTPLKYEMYLQAPTTRKYPNVPLPPTYGTADGDQLLMTARRRTQLTTGSSIIDISLDRQGKDFDKISAKHLASVRGSWSGLDYTITAPCKFDFNRESRQYLELGSIRFEQNRVGSGAGPRRISICLPAVREDPEAMDPWPPATPSRAARSKENREEDDDDDEDEEEDALEEVYQTMEYVPQSKKESLRKLVRRQPPASATTSGATHVTPNAGGLPANQFIYARNRTPYYLESISAFSLDFFGRVTLPSNKNCLLTCDDHNSSSAGPESNIILFGKIGVKGKNADADVYTLDFQWPLSPLQAFCIAVASCDRKLGCA